MEQFKINRINELAKKSREQGLTEAEKREQAQLRDEYVKAYRENLVAQLENTYIIDKNGNKVKVQKKPKKQ